MDCLNRESVYKNIENRMNCSRAFRDFTWVRMIHVSEVLKIAGAGGKSSFLRLKNITSDDTKCTSSSYDVLFIIFSTILRSI